ncbi:MAG: glycosyl transferase [Clostridia bacterium]|nr:glycosyl transferase [Clostridia bacterium]
MIPKTIHYCWFGGNPKPKLAEKCIKSWKKYCPDYEIIEWNEDNFDISSCPLYVRQAYELKKWPFVTDYVRLKVVYDHGGIYMDTDVELKKSLDSLLEYQAYFGFEKGKYIATGLGFGAEAGANILVDLMKDYYDISFILSDGSIDRTPCPKRNTQTFQKWGLKLDDNRQILREEILILPTIYLCPIDYETRLMRYSMKTISIHWFAAAWQTEQEKEWWKIKQKRNRKWKMNDTIIHLPNRLVCKLLGVEKYEKVKHFFENF